MLKLDDDSLTFEFPEITRQVHSLAERHIEDILPKFQLPADRTELVASLFQRPGGSERWDNTDLQQRLTLCAAAELLTEKDIVTALRQQAGLQDDSPAKVTIEFQRTLRIPDDGKVYPLPKGLGQFPLRSVDDYPDTAPDSWMQRGGVAMPMYQSEALWIHFSSRYPFALQIGSGKINAVSGEPWNPDLRQTPQNYVVLPQQPWLDGFAVGEGLIRQFVAMPLGAGYSVEEQLTGKADVGGIQLQAYPMLAEAYFEKKILPQMSSTLGELLQHLLADYLEPRYDSISRCLESPSMGLGAGGKMRQEIYKDPYDVSDWDQTQTSRCFVHLCNSMFWRQFTGTNPPHPPLTTKEYKQADIPWFDYYRDDLKPLKGSKKLAGVKSVVALDQEKNSQSFSDNTSIAPDLIVQYGNTRRPREIREFWAAP